MIPLTFPEFAEKMEWEGDVADMLDWGGPDCFPVEIQELARSAWRALRILEDEVEAHLSALEDAE